MKNDALNQIAAAYGSVPISSGAQTVYLPTYAFEAAEDTAFGAFYDDNGDELALHPWKGVTLASGSMAFFGQQVRKFTITSGGLGQVYPAKDPAEVTPQVVGIETSTDGAKVIVEFDMPLSSVGLDPDNFLVSTNEGVPEEATAVSLHSGDNKKLDITCATGLLFGDTATVYAFKAVQSIYAAPAVIDGEVTNAVDDTVPALVSAATNTAGTLVVLTYDLDMADPSDHAADFSIEVDSTGVTVSAAALGTDIKTIELTLAEAVLNGEVVTVSMEAGNVKNTLGVPAAALTDQEVTNNVPA